MKLTLFERLVGFIAAAYNIIAAIFGSDFFERLISFVVSNKLLVIIIVVMTIWLIGNSGDKKE